jgi:predicted 3-demethylubiquinone-9 3-methyltransferase (glyoxalase superfamily)
MQKITPFLWFDRNAEEAMNFYVEVFKNSPSKEAKDSEIVSIKRYPGGYSQGPMADMEGKVLTGVFKLAGQRFMALDGGQQGWKFNEAISFYVECEDQAEIDYFFEKLSAVPESEICGWLKDKYGLSWQIIPKNMDQLIKTKPAMDAMLKMKKIIITDLEKASSEK